MAELFKHGSDIYLQACMAKLFKHRFGISLLVLSCFIFSLLHKANHVVLKF